MNNPIESIPVEVAKLSPDLYLLEVGLIGVLLIGTAMIGLMLRANRKRDDALIELTEHQRVATQALADSCHAQQERSRETMYGVAERLGENGVLVQEVRVSLDKNTAMLDRVHGVLDKNGATRPH